MADHIVRVIDNRVVIEISGVPTALLAGASEAAVTATQKAAEAQEQADLATTAAATAVATIQGANRRRKVPPGFVRGDGATQNDIFPKAVNGRGPGSVVMNKLPLEKARELSPVIARMNQPDLWVSAAGNPANDGLTRATPTTLADALQNRTGFRYIFIINDGVYPPVPLRQGTHAGAADPKWLVAIDGLVRIAADTSLKQPTDPTQVWTLHSGNVYKTNLASAQLDRPQRLRNVFVPDPIDGWAISVTKAASVAALTALGAAGEAWYFDAGTDDLYATRFGTDLTLVANRPYQIAYSDKVLDTTGALASEWVLGGVAVILEGNFTLDGVWINSREEGGQTPVLLAQGRLLQISSTSYGVRTEGLLYFSGWRCYRSRNDGLNGYGSPTGVVGHGILHDVIVSGTGDIDTFGTAAFTPNCQGASAHGKYNLMVFGGLMEKCFGQGFGDISMAGHNSKTWLVGCVTRDNYADGGTSNGFYFDQSAGGSREIWLDSCASEGNTRDLVTIGCVVRHFNCDLPVRLLLSGGTYVAYDPANP